VPADTSDIVGVEPPPFDRTDSHLFGEDAPAAPAPAAPADLGAASSIDDLMEPDDALLGPAGPPASGFVADLPSDESRERLSATYLEEARRAARQGRRVTTVESGGRKGIGKGPLIASAVLTVAVAGGAAFTVMRGKQEAQGDDFARLDPAAPLAPAADAAATDDVLFAEPAEAVADPALIETDPAGLLEPAAPAATPPASPAAKPAAAAATPAAPAVTLDRGRPRWRSGRPARLRAGTPAKSGEKRRKGVQILLKDAAWPRPGHGRLSPRQALRARRGRPPRHGSFARSNGPRKAAIGGNRLKAMHDLAVFYAEGDAGPQSYAAAVEWFRQPPPTSASWTASTTSLSSTSRASVLSQDKPEAAYWYEVAGRAGDQDASRRARTMLAEMQPTQAEAIKRKARAFNPKPSIARANGDFGRRAWDIATPTQVAEAQRLLQRLGYAPGTTDGKPSPRTADAIRQFERANDLPVTGEASVSLLRQLRAATLSLGD
jgi:localization factor PodJL